MNLNLNDKEEIENKHWLTDKHMTAVTNILKRQYTQLQGFQLTTNTPFFVEKDKKWNTDKKFYKQSAPSVQLHFDGQNHWAVSMQQLKEPHYIYYIDSLSDSLKMLKNNVQIQLSQIYTSQNSILQIKVPRVQQQPNSYDCGLFAIAHAVEFCYNNGQINTNVSFIVEEMRKHLVYCLENGKFYPFPKEIKKTRTAAFTGIPKIFKIKTFCSCEMPEFVDNLVYCGNRTCKKWYHHKCVGIKKNIRKSLDNWSWECTKCKKINK